MDCKAASELIMKYLDKEIEIEEEKELYEHLKSCGDCMLEFKTLKDACLLMEETELEEAPEGLERAVINKILSEDRSLARLRNFKAGLLASMFILAAWLGLACLFIYTPAALIIVDSFSAFFHIINAFVVLTGELLSAGLAVVQKMFTLGRAFAVVQRLIIEMYSTVILAVILFMAVVIKMYGHKFNLVRR